MARVKKIPRRILRSSRPMEAHKIERIILIRRKYIDQHDQIFILCDAILRKGIYPHKHVTDILVNEADALQNDCFTKMTCVQLRRRRVRLDQFHFKYEWRYPDNCPFQPNVLVQIEEVGKRDE